MHWGNFFGNLSLSLSPQSTLALLIVTYYWKFCTSPRNRRIFATEGLSGKKDTVAKVLLWRESIVARVDCGESPPLVLWGCDVPGHQSRWVDCSQPRGATQINSFSLFTGQCAHAGFIGHARGAFDLLETHPLVIRRWILLLKKKLSVWCFCF